jgi:hypothetical protein
MGDGHVSAEGISAAPDYLASRDPTGTYARLKDTLVVHPFRPVEPSTPKPPGHVRIVCISGEVWRCLCDIAECVPIPPLAFVLTDTHNHRPSLPAGDVVIHAGDLSDTGSVKDVAGFCYWFATLPHKHKVK